MKFLQSLYRSLFDIEWLRSKRDTRLWPAIGFLFVVVTTITVLRTAPIFGIMFPRLVSTVEQKLRTDVPDFALVMEDGKLRTEKLPQPYTFTAQSKEGNFTLVIDTVSTSTPEVASLIKNKETDVALVFGRDSVNYFDPENKELVNQTYTDVPNGTLTKDQVLSWVQTFWNKYLVPVTIGLEVFVILCMFVIRLVALVLWSLLLLLIVKIKKLDWKFGEIYRVSAYASTLPLLVGSVMFWFGWSLPAASITFMVLLYLTIVSPDSVVTPKVAEPKV